MPLHVKKRTKKSVTIEYVTRSGEVYTLNVRGVFNDENEAKLAALALAHSRGIINPAQYMALRSHITSPRKQDMRELGRIGMQKRWGSKKRK